MRWQQNRANPTLISPEKLSIEKKTLTSQSRENEIRERIAWRKALQFREEQQEAAKTWERNRKWRELQEKRAKEEALEDAEADAEAEHDEWLKGQAWREGQGKTLPRSGSPRALTATVRTGMSASVPRGDRKRSKSANAVAER